MDADEVRLHRMHDEWCELDEAMIVTFQTLDPIGQWPWLSTHPRVMAAWEALTRPEHLEDLEFRWAYHDGGAAMNHWAAEVTRKAIEVSRSRVAGTLVGFAALAHPTLGVLMSVVPQTRATLEDLAREPGKAELIGGRIVRQAPSGPGPNLVAGQIYLSLHDYADQAGRGEAFTGSLAFVVPTLPSGRQSFSPDASYYDGPLPADPMGFVEGPPTFAVEVRSEGDYGAAAEAEMAAKRRDYFAAGTPVVWDVDPIAELVHVYRATAPDAPTTYRRGEEAEAEPGVPGWRVDVDWIFG